MCRKHLLDLPYIRAERDLGLFTTTIAMQDLDAVRVQLGVAQVNLVGMSYGTRAALEYMRQYPQAVRRSVLDGVAPPDMVLPASFSPDSQAALDALLDACAAAAPCAKAFPTLRDDWAGLLAGLPREVAVADPASGRVDTVLLTRERVLGAVRGPLYAPALAAGLPAAIAAAARGRFEPLAGLAEALAPRHDNRLAIGMHFSVVCAEDAPRLATVAEAPGRDFGGDFARLYERACANWPRGAVPAAFYAVPPFPRPVLLTSGGADPATPPRHGERVARALGPSARHVVVPQAGHGVLAIGCMRDVLFRFIDAADNAEALGVDTDCAAQVPRPPAFVPVGARGGGFAVIRIERLAKSFVVPGRGRLSFGRRSAAQRVVAVEDVSFDAADGRITGLLGPNGAGKTTTLRMLAALIEPDAGELHVDALDVRTQPRAALACMGVLSDARGLYPRLTARENIVYYAALQGMAADAAHARVDALARMLEMTPLLDRRTDGFSQGERMKTALARALVHDPKHIVLDEPTNGLDVLATRALRDALRWLRTPEGGGKCIVFSTHIMQEVERLCDSVVVVAHGRTVAQGSVDELLARTGTDDFEEAFVRLAFGAEPVA